MTNSHFEWTSAELSLARLAVSLGGTEHGGPLSSNEARLASAATASPAPAPSDVRNIADAIRAGSDPLGDRLTAVRSQSKRRGLGQVLTPKAITEPMVAWALDRAPTRFVDAGCGTGRFALEIARRSDAPIVAVDTDPLATLLTRGGLAALNRKAEVSVLNNDYMQLRLPPHDGRTAFIGNPPYVRHHNLAAHTKEWGQLTARRLGIRFSGLAGLHAYFFLATAVHAQPGDIGCLVTSSEWLDVNYGDAVRSLLLDGLGGCSVNIIDPQALPFGNVATTAAVTCFEVGSRPNSLLMRMVGDTADLPPMDSGCPVPRRRLEQAARWTSLVRATPTMPDGHIELGEICRVHRGQVTGSNAIWVVPAGRRVSLPDRYLLPSVTRARELTDAGERLESADSLRRVIDLPPDLDELEANEREQVEDFLRSALAAGAADGYVARNRNAWWSVGLREPAPLLATYMARRLPAFVRNIAGARHINIAHGIYPRVVLPERALDKLAEALRSAVRLELGRTYAGGLVKFEPREMERIPVPALDRLLED